LQGYQRRAPSAATGVGQLKIQDAFLTRQTSVHGAPQHPGAFAVNNPDRENAAPPTFRQIVVQQFTNLGRSKGMQIEHAVNRIVKRCIRVIKRRVGIGGRGVLHFYFPQCGIVVNLHKNEVNAMKKMQLPGWVIFLMIIGWACSQTTPVMLGNEVLLQDYLHLVQGKRVGLITNPTGVNSRLEPTIDVLAAHPQIQLTALFGPEHGVRGDITAGATVETFNDPRTGIPIYSLYGRTRRPTDDMLRNVDVLMYDIQDIGSRAYTYIYTMALAMEAARDKQIPFIVLDRPNPLGGLLVEGPVLDTVFSSFIGLYPIPFVYGMTVGELAQLFNREFGINCDLKVVPMKGWKRKMLYEDTGLEWVITSPHVPHARSARFAAATGIIGELQTIDIGIGYTLPFELTGEAWIDGERLARELNARQLPGIIFRPVHYRPYYFTRRDSDLQGIQLHITDLRRFKPQRTQIHILTAICKLFPDQPFFQTERTRSFDRAMGTDQVRLAAARGKSAEEIIAGWQKELDQFKQTRAKYLIYR